MTHVELQVGGMLGREILDRARVWRGPPLSGRRPQRGPPPPPTPPPDLQPVFARSLVSMKEAPSFHFRRSNWGQKSRTQVQARRGASRCPPSPSFPDPDLPSRLPHPLVPSSSSSFPFPDFTESRASPTSSPPWCSSQKCMTAFSLKDLCENGRGSAREDKYSWRCVDSPSLFSLCRYLLLVSSQLSTDRSASNFSHKRRELKGEGGGLHLLFSSFFSLFSRRRRSSESDEKGKVCMCVRDRREFLISALLRLLKRPERSERPRRP